MKSSWAFLLVVTAAASLTAIASSADGSRQRADIIVPDDARPVYDAWGFAPAGSNRL